MNRKEKFLQVIKDKGYESVVDLMIAVEAVILKDKTKAYEKATTCKNYYTMIEGTSRDFPREYIIALEKVLDMKYIDMINPLVDDKPKLQYDSLRSIAFANDYEKTKEFALKTANDDQIMTYGKKYEIHILKERIVTIIQTKNQDLSSQKQLLLFLMTMVAFKMIIMMTTNMMINDEGGKRYV